MREKREGLRLLDRLANMSIKDGFKKRLFNRGI